MSIVFININDICLLFYWEVKIECLLIKIIMLNRLYILLNIDYIKDEVKTGR